MNPGDGPSIGRTYTDSRPWWPDPTRPPAGAPNILVVLFDDVGFSDFGCYGSPIRTPAIDALANGGLRYANFHTTAMCSTTRAALLTGRNHHSVGVGCLANFDSGYPGYRGKISREAGTAAEILGAAGYATYMVGKWHVTPLTETGPAGPFDGWPLGRGFDRFYGFMDAETDQYAPELVRDNTPIAPPGGYADGYHLSADLVDQTIRFIAEHLAGAPDRPFFTWLALGACHAPHQAPRELILDYAERFARGWDVERGERLARQMAMGLVPPGTRMPPRNDHVAAWSDLGADEQRLFARLQGAYAAMLDHADQQLARLVAFLERAGLSEDILILVLSDNGASQEGGPLGMINAMGPFNFKPEPLAEKIARIDDIGGPDTHTNFPLGWAMASNTPLRRYKQNTHGGGVRDPLVVNWPGRVPDPGAIRNQFCHASDLLPTLLDLVGVRAPETIRGARQSPMEGESFAASLADAGAPERRTPQYFEMFGHRGLWRDGWKAVAFHPPGADFDADVWELFHLETDFSETRDLAAAEPERLASMIDDWWRLAAACKVLPLDDRFGPRFAENAARGHKRRAYVFHAGVGHIPTDAAPDVRGRDYLIEAEVVIPEGGAQGVLIAHGDATSGYTLHLDGGRLTHDLNIGGRHQVLQAAEPVGPGARTLGFRMRRSAERRTGELLVDGATVASGDLPFGFNTLISWSGLDIGLDRGSPVSHYASPNVFTGALAKVTITMNPDQALDADGAGRAALARE